jgi:hypothetical protein
MGLPIGIKPPWHIPIRDYAAALFDDVDCALFVVLILVHFASFLLLLLGEHIKSWADEMICRLPHHLANLPSLANPHASFQIVREARSNIHPYLFHGYTQQAAAGGLCEILLTVSNLLCVPCLSPYVTELPNKKMQATCYRREAHLQR